MPVKHRAVKSSGDYLYASEWNDYHDVEILRSELEYPTEDVSFAYLDMIGKLAYHINYPWSLTPKYIQNGELCDYPSGRIGFDWILTFLPLDFTDKAIVFLHFGYKAYISARVTGAYKQDGYQYSSHYEALIDISQTTNDHIVSKRISTVGSYTDTVLGSEAIDLADWYPYAWKFSVSGSVLNSFRETFDTAKISVTDTDLVEGYFGIRSRVARTTNQTDARCYDTLGMRAWYKPPSSSHLSSLCIIETEISSSSPYKPTLLSNMKEVTKIQNIPEYISQNLLQNYKRYTILKNKGFTDEEIELLFGKIQTKIDINSVSWGMIDFRTPKGKPTSSTCLICVFSDNPYREGAILRQVEFTRSKNLKVYKPLFDMSKIREIWKSEHEERDWLITENELAYQVLGHEHLEIEAIADFYERELDQLNRIKNVRTEILHASLNMWINRAKKFNKDDVVKRLWKFTQRMTKKEIKSILKSGELVKLK